MTENDLHSHVLDFLVYSEVAKNCARETRSKTKKGHNAHRLTGIELSQILRKKKDDVIFRWRDAVKGKVHGATFFHDDDYPVLFDALIVTFASEASPPNTSEIIKFCGDVVQRSMKTISGSTGKESIHMLRKSIDAIDLFGDVARSHLNFNLSGSTSDDDILQPLYSNPSMTALDRMELQAASNSWKADKELNSPTSAVFDFDAVIVETLKLTNDCLEIAFKRCHEDVNTYMLLAEARESLADAREELLQALEQVRQLIPPAPKIIGTDVISSVKKATATANALKDWAQRLALLSPYSERQTNRVDASLLEKQVQDIRRALVILLRTRAEELSANWRKMITERVQAYKKDGSSAPVTQESLDAQVVSKELNQMLINAMIERLRPDGDSASLVYICQRLVEFRYGKMEPESVVHAIRLFEDVSLDMVGHAIRDNLITYDLWPLVHADEAVLRKMLADVVYLATRLVNSEYKMRAAHQQDPRLPAYLLSKQGEEISYEEIRKRVPEILRGSKIAGLYRIEAHIMSGGFGHGWRAVTLDREEKDVFIKSFKSKEEFPPGADTVVVKMVEELEIAERIQKVNRLMKNPHIVTITNVLRNNQIIVPSTEKECHEFHGIVTEYCDGGELFNYIVVPKDSGGLKGWSFSEGHAWFLFRQIISLLMELYEPTVGSGNAQSRKSGDDGNSEDSAAYFHGDIKDQNLVLSGSTIKLIDYGTLSKVSQHKGPVKHMTPSHMQPFHDNCESVDLWAAGIILLDMLVIDKIGQMFRVAANANPGVSALKHGQFWEKIDSKLKSKYPDHCLLKTGPDTVRNLLEQIFVTEPKNSLSVLKISQHPWLKKDHGVTPAEMEQELKSRFKGIRYGAPRGSASFDLGKQASVSPEYAYQVMCDVIKSACESSQGEFVLAQSTENKSGCIMVHRWEKPTETATPDSGFTRMHDTDGQWVVAKYECSLEEAFDIAANRNLTKMKVWWMSGNASSSHSDFSKFVNLVMQAIMRAHL